MTTVDKNKARSKSRLAVKAGRIVKVPCLVCGDRRSEMHHYDYSKPFDVLWLCKAHHNEIHRLLSPSTREFCKDCDSLISEALIGRFVRCITCHIKRYGLRGKEPHLLYNLFVRYHNVPDTQRSLCVTGRI